VARRVVFSPEKAIAHKNACPASRHDAGPERSVAVGAETASRIELSGAIGVRLWR